MQRGFSLVELSIVLVILGLLVGGILTGRSLIRAAELRAVGTEYQRYIAAVQGFKDRYFAIPGDFGDGTRVWGRMHANADCIRNNTTAPVTASGVCDGNGDNRLTSSGAPASSGEIYQFWRHLARAGLIEGDYSGQAGPESTAHAVLGTNVPASRMARLGWSVRELMYNYMADGPNFPMPAGAQLIFGAAYVGVGPVYGATYGGGLNAQEAWNIDTKIDDGKPGLGKALVYNRHVCSVSESAYALTYTGTQCGFYFLRPF